MIQELRIKNLALIEELSIEFESGLTVFTGETGAGKSILLGAIGLLLGERASADMIRSGFEEAEVNGTFVLYSKSSALLALLDDLSIEPEDNSLIIRRKITKTDRNKIHVNQVPLPLSSLKKLGDLLIDLHGQHEHQSLLNEDTHITVIDSLPGVSELKEIYNTAFIEYQNAQEALSVHRKKTKQLSERKEFLEYQLKEIQSLDPQPGEEETLESELSLLSSSAERSTCASEIIELLSGDSGSIEQKINHLKKRLDSLSKYDPSVEPWIRDIESASATLTELETFCSSYLDRIGAHGDPARIEQINSKLSKIQRLKKKYSCSLEQLIKLKESMEQDLNAIVNATSDETLLSKNCDTTYAICLEKGKFLSEIRSKATDKFDKEITILMEKLGFKGGKLVSTATPLPQPSICGLETIRFYTRTNQGEPLLPLSKSVSGGEVSRIMLAIKTVLAGHDNIPVLIFDEIDTGIGGTVASEVGKALTELSSSHQVLCISHLHQIASIAKRHMRVYKETSAERTVTHVVNLDHNGRIEELARMLGGASDITIKHAEALLRK